MVERTLPKPDTRVRFPSAAPQAPDLMVWGFIFWRVEAVCSLLLQGTRPRFASDTLMSRRNIPTSPLLLSPSSLWYEVGCGCAAGNEPRDTRLGKSVRERGGGILGLGTAGSSPRMNIGFRGLRWFRRDVRAPSRGLIETGLVVAPYERTAQLYLPEATSGCPSSARAGPLQERRKCIASQAHTSKASHRTRQASLQG